MKSLKQVHVCVLFIKKNASYLCNFCRFLANQIPLRLYMQLGTPNKTLLKPHWNQSVHSIIFIFLVLLNLTILYTLRFIWEIHETATFISFELLSNKEVGEKLLCRPAVQVL